MFANTRRKYRVIQIAWLLLMATPSVALAERLPLRAYTVADGLAHNEINKIVRDSRGFLWFCTAEGLSRFDGYEFTNYGTDQGLPHPTVNDFLQTRNGELWVATNWGLVLFDPKGRPSNRIIYANQEPDESAMFTVVVAEGEDRYARAITVLLEGRDGTVWAGTMKGLYRLQRNRGNYELLFVDLPLRLNAVPPYVLDLLEDQHGSLWVGSFGALYRRWPDGSTARYTRHDGLPDDNIHDLFEDHRGQLWAGTRGYGFFRFTADDSHAPPAVTFTLAVRDLEQSEWINQLFETSDHKLWAATANGLIEFIPDGDDQGRHYRLYTTKNGLSDRSITALNEDMGGNLWLGGYFAGAMKLARDGFISYGEQDSLLTVFAIFENRAGEVCFRGSVLGDERTSVFEGAKWDLLRPLENRYTRYGRFDGRSFTWLKPNALADIQLGWVGEGVTLQARNGEWWLGTGVGLHRFPAMDDFAQLKRARPLAVYTTKDGLTAPQVFRLFEDSRGNIWVSAIGPNGLACWERVSETLNGLTNAPGLPPPMDDLARSFGEDREGNVWIGFSTGVARYRDGSFTFFDAADGLPPGAIQYIYSDRSERLWLASSRSGLVRVDDPGGERPSFNAYTTAQGLSSNNAEVIAEDLRGRIYVGTGRGLDRLDPTTGHVKHFTTADGLAPGKILAAYRDRDGVLWFGTWKGLSRFTPGRDAMPAPPPPLLITALSVAGERQMVSALGETEIYLPDLSADRNQLHIDFVGLSFAPGDVLRYQYQLEGTDADWSTPSEQRTVNYANLAPGRYRFLVRALNSDGLVSASPAVLTFVVLPHIWQRWWFIALVALFLGIIVYAMYRYRVARILELASIRTRIATDLHDDIGANLTKISILSEVARQQGGNGEGSTNSPLASIARISRESVTAMSDIVWAVNPRRDSLGDLIRRMRLHAEESCLYREIELSFQAPAREQALRLGVDQRRDLFLIFKEAVSNSVRHSGCSKLEVTLTLEKGVVTLTIIDNGKGFDSTVESEGNGLISMQRRAQSLGAKLKIESQADQGTSIRVTVPLAAKKLLHKS